MGNFCGSACEECVTELEGGLFHSVLHHSRGEHQKTLFIPKCDFGSLVLVKALREQCILPGDVWEAAFVLGKESVVPQDAGFVIANGRSCPSTQRDTSVFLWKALTNCAAQGFLLNSLQKWPWKEAFHLLQNSPVLYSIYFHLLAESFAGWAHSEGKALWFSPCTSQFITHVGPDAELRRRHFKACPNKILLLKSSSFRSCQQLQASPEHIEKQFVTSAFSNLSLGLATNSLNWKSIKRLKGQSCTEQVLPRDAILVDRVVLEVEGG